MTPIQFFAQIVGFFALGFIVYSYQKNDHKEIMKNHFIACILFVIHFLMLSAYTGAIMNVIASFRAIIYANQDKKWGKLTLWPLVFGLLFIVSGIATWEGIVSIFPVLAMVVSSFTLFIKKPMLNRTLTFPCSILWIIYNFNASSFVGILSEAFVMTSIIVGFFRHDTAKKVAE